MSPRRAAFIAAAAAVGVAIWWDAPPSSTHQVFVPHVSQRRASAHPPRILRPSTPGALIDALTVPGALVVPSPGTYHLPVQAGIADGVTLNGRGQVRITGHGLGVRGGRVRVAGVEISGVKGDGVTVLGGVAEFEDIDVSRATDGLLDLYGGAHVWVTDSTFHDNVRGVLCGNWQQPLDGRERLVLRGVEFEDVRVRTPKLQDCDAVAEDLTVINGVEWPIDLRGSSTLFAWNLTIVYGPKTNPPGWIAEPGSRVEVW